MLAYDHDPITTAAKLNEYRMSNKEFRMMKLKTLIVSFGVLYSAFEILRFTRLGRVRF
jgi:hypothetical protein